jgi:hypothetical protein
MSDETARNRARLRSAQRSRRAPARSRIALEQERGTDVYARKNIFSLQSPI